MLQCDRKKHRLHQVFYPFFKPCNALGCLCGTLGLHSGEATPGKCFSHKGSCTYYVMADGWGGLSK